MYKYKGKNLAERIENLIFICPNCHQFTKIDANLLPYSVKSNAIKIAEKYGAFYDSYLGELKDPITEKQKKL